VADRNQAEQIKHLKIWVPVEEVDVAEDEYLWEDLIGCEVVRADSGELIGEVTALEEYGAQDILVVSTDPKAATQGEWMLPFIEDVVLEVDMEMRHITVDLPEGMDACFTLRF